MPFTLFHYPFGYGLSKTSKRLNMPALLVGAVIPDIEVPLLFLFFQGVFPDHFVLHSLVGALSGGLVLAVLITRYAYPTVIGSIFKLDKQELKQKCLISRALVASAILGIVSHLLVDILHHWYNPILWPWIADPYAIAGPLCIFFANVLSTDIMTGYYVANLLTHIVIVPVFLLIIIRTKENRWHRLWIGE
ncbi:MAG: DUF4184 family protein [Candidatus Thorarchaeota archaeon]